MDPEKMFDAVRIIDIKNCRIIKMTNDEITSKQTIDATELRGVEADGQPSNPMWATMHRLGIVQGIGIAVEDRLCRAGIKSCNQLVDTSPQKIREILGYLAQGSDIEHWIEQARELIGEHAL